MAKIQVYYKGRRKRKNYAIIPFLILLAVVALTVVTFYSMQKYAVITKESVSVELPILKDGTEAVIDSTGHVTRNFETVNATIEYRDPDFTGMEAVAGDGLDGVRAIFVPAADISRDRLMQYAGRLVSGNALVLEMKPRSGEILWETHSSITTNYALDTPGDVAMAMPEIIDMLKFQNVYLVAQISCCIDNTLPARTSTFCLHTESGMNYSDGYGTWLDPYNIEVRKWVAEMAQELFDLGFDEVVLADVSHPVITEDMNINLVYTRQMTTSPSVSVAVCGFARYVAQELENRDSGVLSIYVDSSDSLVRTNALNGQNALAFFKVYDRVYLRTDKYSYSFNVDDVRYSLEKGNVYDRLVPVVINYIPDNTSWVLIDAEED